MLDGYQDIQFPFEHEKFNHELVERQGLFCIVRRSRLRHPKQPPHFEVVRLRPGKAFSPAPGVFVPAKIHYPSTEMWGTYGFTCNTLEKAKERFAKLIKTQTALRGNAYGVFCSSEGPDYQPDSQTSS